MAFTMLNYSFVIFYFALVFQESFALNWCSSDGLPTLLHCLLEGEYSVNWSETLNQRIRCSKEGDCTPRPWQVFDKKVELVRNYFECMKEVAATKTNLLTGPEIKELVASEFRCRIALAVNLPDDFKSYYNPLLRIVE